MRALAGVLRIAKLCAPVLHVHILHAPKPHQREQKIGFCHACFKAEVGDCCLQLVDQIGSERAGILGLRGGGLRGCPQSVWERGT